MPLTFSQVTFDSDANTEYYILVSGFTNTVEGGNFTLIVSPGSFNGTNALNNVAQNLYNDICWYAEEIALPSTVSQSTVSSSLTTGGCEYGSTEARAGLCHYWIFAKRLGRWFYYFHQAADTLVTASTCNNATSLMTTIEVYSSCSMYSCLVTRFFFLVYHK